MSYPSQSTVRYWWRPVCTGPWATVSLNGYGRVSVRPAIVEAVKALNQVLRAYRYSTRAADTGAYNCRRVTGGSSYSLHAYAIALDINWQTNPYSRTLRTDMFRNGDGRMPYRIQAIRTNNGKQVWRWGGFFSGNKDAMHYEICCSPADLRTGIRWSTVYGSGTNYYASVPPAYRPVLRQGSRGEWVGFLQRRMNYVTGSDINKDGIFGASTHRAVVNFQRFCKITADGIVGRNTWRMLDYHFSLKQR